MSVASRHLDAGRSRRDLAARGWSKAPQPMTTYRVLGLVIVLLALAVAVPPLTLDAQQAGGKVARVGYVSGAAETRREEAFRRGLRELAYREGKNIVVEYRFAEGRYDQLPRFAAGLAR